MKINVTRSSMPGFEEYCNEIRDLWDSRWLTNMGVKHQQLQAQLEAYMRVPHVTLFTNGHIALETVIEAMEFPAGSEVITTPFTFASTTHAIVRNGLVPVFCDVNAEDYTMDVTKIEALITEKTVAIVPVHVYGNMCNNEAICEIAERHGLKVIYDDMKDYSQALEYHLKSLEISKQFYKKNHPAIARSYSNIASVYNSLSNYTTALKYNKKALKIRINFFGTGHSSVAQSYNNLGTVYHSLKKYSKALQYYKSSLTLCEQLMGKENARVASICNNIGSVYHAMNNKEQALYYYEKSLMINTKILGAEHPKTQKVKENIENVLHN